MPPQQVGRALAGLIGYSPSPGIYSRLERAVEAMPKQVRIQELPGLIKRHKEGVPGWELRAVDLESLINDRPVVPREELLQAVRDRSPVYTHGEVILGGAPDRQYHPGVWASDTEPYWTPDLSAGPAAIGRGRPSGRAKYENYGHGGRDYAELLLTQPAAGEMHASSPFGSHWFHEEAPAGAEDAVAHARYDTHGDALRINELQSDLGIHNRRAREFMAGYQEAAENVPAVDLELARREAGTELPFPLEDAWADILIKRLLLETARRGHRAIEIASPRVIADTVGGNIGNYEHFYGKVVPGALERLGRKMGGLVEDAAAGVPAAPISSMEDWMRSRGMHQPGQMGYDAAQDLRRVLNEQFPSGREQGTRGIGDTAYHLLDRIRHGWPDGVAEAEYLRDALWSSLERAGASETEALASANAAMPQILRQYEAMRAARNRNWDSTEAMTADVATPARQAPPGRRYLMSDAMRKNIIQKGIGASVLAPLIADEEE